MAMLFGSLDANIHSSQKPIEMVPKLFGPIRDRYLTRPGGYTRVLRIEPIKDDQAASAILELVDGPKDMRFAITAQTIARDRCLNRRNTDITQLNKEKILKFRPNGKVELEGMVKKLIEMEELGMEGKTDVTAKKRPNSKLPLPKVSM